MAWVCGVVVPPHETAATCFNHLDDDKDGQADCDDPDCSAGAATKHRCAGSESGVRECTDGVDNGNICFVSVLILFLPDISRSFCAAN